MPFKRRSTVVVIIAIAGILLCARFVVPAIMHRAAIHRLQQDGWDLTTHIAAPEWLPRRAVEWSEIWWERAHALRGPPLDNNGAVSHLNDLDQLRWLPEIRSVDLHGVPDLDHRIQVLRNCRELQELYMTTLDSDNKSLTDEGVEALRDLRELLVLRLSGTGVTDQGLAELRGLTLLIGLTLTATQVNGSGFADWSGRDIEWLHLADTRMSDENMIHLQRFSNLGRLELDRTPITDSGLEALLSLSELGDLSLSGTAVTSQGAGKLAALPALGIINLNWTAIDDQAVAAFADRLPITVLALAGTRITDESISHIVRIRKLHQLILSDTSLSGDAFSRLAACKSLKQLVVENTAITAEALESILRAGSIEKIELTHSQMKDPKIAKLAESDLGRGILAVDPTEIDE